MGLARRCGTVVAFAATAACSLYSASNPMPEGAADAGVEAETPPPPGSASDGAAEGAFDAPVDADAGDAPTGPNLLVNGDFETNGCAGWIGGGLGTSVDTEQQDPHGGSYACLVCGSNTIWNLAQSENLSVGVGERFQGSVWVRASNGSTSVPVQVGVQAGDGSAMTSLVPIGTTWTKIVAPIATAAAAGTGVSMQIAGGGSACIDVDDALLQSVP